MAKAFSDSEKTLIKAKLKKGAIEFIQRYGIRKASVEELVEYAGISKGAFYLFYESKELLFFEAILEYHSQLQEAVSASVSNLKGKVTVDDLTGILFKVIKDNQSFWISLLSDGNLEYIQRKLPEQMLEMHLFDDDRFFHEIILMANVDSNIDTPLVAGTFRAIFLTILNIEIIGEDIYDDVLRALLKSVFQQFFYSKE